MPRQARLDSPGSLHHVIVEQVLSEADEKLQHQHSVRERNRMIEQAIAQGCRKGKVSVAELRSGSRRGAVCEVRGQIATALVEEYGVPMAEIARQVGVSTSAVSKIYSRRNNSTWSTTSPLPFSTS